MLLSSAAFVESLRADDFRSLLAATERELQLLARYSANGLHGKIPVNPQDRRTNVR